MKVGVSRADRRIRTQSWTPVFQVLLLHHKLKIIKYKEAVEESLKGEQVLVSFCASNFLRKINIKKKIFRDFVVCKLLRVSIVV